MTDSNDRFTVLPTTAVVRKRHIPADGTSKRGTASELGFTRDRMLADGYDPPPSSMSSN